MSTTKQITASSEQGLITKALELGASRPYMRRRLKRGGAHVAYVDMPDSKALRLVK